MNAITPETIIAVFAIFCRVGSCLMVAPGFSSQHIPVRVRLYVALAASLAMTPLLIDSVRPVVGDGSATSLLGIVFSEGATGLLIGFVARVFFMALQFIAVAMTQAIGLSALPGTVVEDSEQSPALATLYTTTAIALMFAAGLHTELLRGLIDSYRAIPPGGVFASRVALVDIADQTSAAFVTALRIGSPFIVYSIVVNFAIGVTNKLSPQIPIYFIAMPFVLVGGLLLLGLTVRDFFGTFQEAFASWLVHG